jgi:DNA polymerase III delta subunit
MSNPFFSARLIVKGKNAKLKFDKYGAVEVIRSSSNVYIVQFNTEKNAKEAFKNLKKNAKVVYVEPDGYMGTRDLKSKKDQHLHTLRLTLLFPHSRLM